MTGDDLLAPRTRSSAGRPRRRGRSARRSAPRCRAGGRASPSSTRVTAPRPRGRPSERRRLLVSALRQHVVVGAAERALGVAHEEQRRHRAEIKTPGLNTMSQAATTSSATITQSPHDHRASWRRASSSSPSLGRPLGGERRPALWAAPIAKARRTGRGRAAPTVGRSPRRRCRPPATRRTRRRRASLGPARAVRCAQVGGEPLDCPGLGPRTAWTASTPSTRAPPTQTIAATMCANRSQL